MRTQGKNQQTAQSAGNAADQLVIGVSLAFDWLKEWREFFRAIIQQSGIEHLVEIYSNMHVRFKTETILKTRHPIKVN